MTITLRTIDLQVLLPRVDQTVRYQEREEQQVDLRHQFALQEQKHYSEKGQQVQKPPRGERGRLGSRSEERRRRRQMGKRKGGGEGKRKVQDPLRGRKLDFRV
ncbi:MAG TPA: hypothetical protein GX735_00045 [Firmicutes bacterium]|jgi:hypothetical protein|nr:hypothetical protein [Bacillota bacterium]